jgi:hypothetical protein
VVTGLVSNEKLATPSSTGYFEFCPPGVNERLIGQAGFELVRAEDVTQNEVEVSQRWHAARQQRAAELIQLEGEETFAGLERFLATAPPPDERAAAVALRLTGPQAGRVIAPGREEKRTQFLENSSDC